MGNGNGTFAAPVTLSCRQQLPAVEAADFNGDGKIELAVTTSSSVSVLLNNGQ